MAIRLNWRGGLLFPAAFLSVLGTHSVDAQVSTMGPSQATSQFGDFPMATTERIQAYTYGVDAGIGETDNVALVRSDKVSQTMTTVDADFTVNERSRLFDVNAVGSFTDLDYLQHAYGNELLGRFDGSAGAAIVPGRLTWLLRDDFGQQGVDPYTPVTPANIENVNYMTTGPDLKLPFGGIDFVDLSARYARAQYQTSPFNSNRLIGTAALGRNMSADASVSLNANTERILFDNTLLNTDYERSSGFSRYEVHGARTDFVGEMGGTVVTQSGAPTIISVPNVGLGAADVFESNPPVVASESRGSGSVSGPLAKLEFSRRISAAAKLIVTAGRDLTDTSSSFANQSTSVTGINPVAPGELTSATYRVTYTTAGWQYRRNRTTLSLTGRWEADIYPGLSPLDTRMTGADFNVERRITRAFTVQVLGRWYKTDYPHAMLASQATGSTDITDTVLGAALTWRHGRALEIRLRCDRNIQAVAAGNAGYSENRAFLTIGYRPRAVQDDEE
jgi:hypothetical protein